MKRIILASTSPRRKELLAETGIEFDVIAGTYEEDMTLPLPPVTLAQHLALGKARSAAAHIENALVIGADTIVTINNIALGKPRTLERAREMIHMLSGKSHTIITGYAVVDSTTKKEKTGFAETKVFFKQLSENDIEEYLAVSSALDRAGAYAIQDHGGTMLMEHYEGDYANALGLPVAEILKLLNAFESNI